NLGLQSAALIFAKYEMVAGLPPPLLSRATATAHVTRQRPGPAAKQIHERAKLRPHRAHVPSPPARLRVGRIAATNRSDRTVSIATRGVRQAAISNACHLWHIGAFSRGSYAAPNLPVETPCRVPRRSTS